MLPNARNQNPYRECVLKWKKAEPVLHELIRPGNPYKLFPFFLFVQGNVYDNIVMMTTVKAVAIVAAAGHDCDGMVIHTV